MLRPPGEHRVPRPSRRCPGPHRARLLALACAVACAALLPLTAASGSVREEGRGGPGGAVGPGERTRGDNGKAPLGIPGGPRAPAGPDRSPESPTPSAASPALGVGVGTAVRCGPELATPGGIEAQTCVLIQGTETWARTYYRNATGAALTAVLGLMGPGGRAVRTHCAIGAGDAPAMCETPREPAGDGPWVHTAVAEFAEAGSGARGSLLLRSGSNSPVQTGS
ncbi:hypothetical protein ABZ354_15970 [Streptomyces sp. NPDC005925]|uniref:hypothetical protein n=1 Tax=Streptomyces sp. NPDC005925 TaxID=3157172 RepID=UPI0033D4586D